MYYTELLRVSRGLVWFTLIFAVLYLLVVGTMAANGVLGHPLDGGPDSNIPLPALFAISGFAAAIFASCFARSLSEENESHLPVIWTKPVSRVRAALAIIGVDVLGVVTAFAIAFGACILFITTFGGFRFIEAGPDAGLQAARFLAFPLAYFGIIAAMTASLGRSSRGVIWFVWLGSMLLSGLGAVGFPRPWSVVIATINYLNPLEYSTYSHTSGSNTISVMGPQQVHALAVNADVVALACLCVIGIAAGVWQWRRLEA